MTGEDDAVDVARELTGSLQALAGQMSRLTRSEKRNRRIIAGLVISFALDLAVTAGLGYNTIRQNSTQDAIHASEIQQCQLANGTRRQDIAIWNRLLTVPASAPAAQKAEVADLRRLVQVKDMPRDCAAAYKK